MTEHEPLRMFRSFSQIACSLMNARSMTIGIVDDTRHLSGRFCTTTIINEQTATYYSDSCPLIDSILNPLYHGTEAMRLSKSNSFNLLKNKFDDQALACSFLGIPIQSAAQQYGVLYFLDKNNADEFDKEDLQMAKTMVSQIVILYENIKLYDTLHEYTAKLNCEVNARKKIENKLRTKQDFLKLALNVGQMNSWSLNVHTNKINEFGFLGALSQSETGTKESNLNNFLSRVIPEDRELIVKKLKDTHQLGVALEMEFRILLPNNKIEWISSRGQLFHDRRTDSVLIIGIGVIITELKKMEELTRQDQEKLEINAKLSAMEEMASTLAHELAQPLTAINVYLGGCIYRLSHGIQTKEPLLFAMNKILENIDIAGKIIKRMKNCTI